MAQWSRNGQFPVAVRAAHDGKTLYLSYSVKDASPWVNNGKDWQLLFKTGDSVDLQLGTDPRQPQALRACDRRLAAADRSLPGRQRRRALSAPPAGCGRQRRLPVPVAKRESRFGAEIKSAKIAVSRSGDSYLVKAAVPLADLGLDASAFGKPLRCDFGVVYGDAEGTTNIFRNYWSNQATGLINDVPGEIMLNPNLWGDVTLEIVP